MIEERMIAVMAYVVYVVGLVVFASFLSFEGIVTISMHGWKSWVRVALVSAFWPLVAINWIAKKILRLLD